MIISINYADSQFEISRQYNTKTAYSKGKVDKVIEYSPSDLDEDFKKRNSTILSYTRGAGLWLWKPYIILDALKKINEGDFLFYCDAGSYFVGDVRNLIDTLKISNQKIMPFEIPLLERQFTKKETFVIMDYSNYNDNQICTGYILFKKCSKTVSFVEEWLMLMRDERLCSFKHFCPDIKEFDDFRAHREDQSVFSILCRKKELKVFRDPSNYGERPWMYGRNNFDVVLKKYPNSTYPKILISNRKMNPKRYMLKEFVMHYAWRLGIFNQTVCYKLHKVNRKPIIGY